MRPSLQPDTHCSPERKTCASPALWVSPTTSHGNNSARTTCLSSIPPITHHGSPPVGHSSAIAPRPEAEALETPRLLPSLSSADYTFPSSPTPARFKNAMGGCVLLSGLIGVCLNIQIMIPLSRTEFQQSALFPATRPVHSLAHALTRHLYPSPRSTPLTCPSFPAGTVAG